ncbi:hypothetical protein NCTGTJJY_CDS0057 [Serratia phage 92A1]|nr:hypothetical protein NCTGTJJY_CDS0057 [Serratia phage 92A1]
MIYIKLDQIPTVVKAVKSASLINHNRTELILTKSDNPEFVKIGVIQDGLPVMDFDLFKALTMAKY